MLQSIIQRYQSHLIERPIRTFAIQSGALQLVGDTFTQQAIEKRGTEHDFGRSLRMLTYGVCVSGPIVGGWFGFVNRFVTIKHWFGAALARTAMDQILFTPFILSCFIGGISILERRNMNEIKEKFEKSYFEGLTNAYRFWPMANLFVFSMVPFMYRPVVNGTFALGWNAYLSHLNQTSLQPYPVSSLTESHHPKAETTTKTSMTSL